MADYSKTTPERVLLDVGLTGALTVSSLVAYTDFFWGQVFSTEQTVTDEDVGVPEQEMTDQDADMSDTESTPLTYGTVDSA